ncbi:hypothetical protein CPB86DRAFT_816556 [Serendipita vermifera]|nr:hypothetical protein CPB86DRAFT_816556 [Serendipita vermifera]
MEFEELQAAKDIKTLDAKLKDIDSYLKLRQDGYQRYITKAEGEEVQALAEGGLSDAIFRIQKARDQLPDIKDTLLRKPPPSEYAIARNWADLQQLPNPMLCMRPVECRGLPIFLLHSVFAQYCSLSKKMLPATREAGIALQVARTLCNTMGNYFDGESPRRTAFIQAIEPLFSRWMTINEATAQGIKASTRTDASILEKEKGVVMVLTEIKNGKVTGDAYMQASRGYEINTETLKEKHRDFLACGAPTFICCLEDEELRIAGAFKDGEQVVVEALSYDLMSPDSREDGRTIQLAQHLFALYSCLETLVEEIAEPVLPLTNAPGCPRVFSEVRNTETDQNEQLQFKKLRKDFWQTTSGTIDYLNLIFDANLGGKNVLAKVVLRPYGKDVHAHLAAQHMAPRLYGTGDVQGIASVVVMQLLEDGWITLFDYRKNWHPDGIQEDRRSRLLERLEEILKCLGDGGMVHGDFRMANIMLKEGEEEKAMLIDFDWAGEAGKATYPVTRSGGFGYPGKPGGLISAGDDRWFYETWKKEISLALYSRPTEIPKVATMHAFPKSKRTS